MPDSATIALAEALRPALLRLSRQLRRQSQSLGLSAIEVMLLGTINAHPGIGLSELADREQMSRPAMSAHVKRLEAAGYIDRAAPDPQDRRRVGLEITAAGKAACEAVRQRRNDRLAQKLAGLAPKDREALAGAIGALSEIAGERS